MAIKFRKKPVVIEAMRWNEGLLWGKYECMTPEHWIPEKDFHVADGILYIHTLEGNMEASPGDWVIKGVKGEFYPCKPDIFEQTYEEVVE